MEIYPLDLLIHIINIVVLYILLRLILFKPVSRYLSARSERIQNQLNEAKSSLEEADSLKNEYKQQLEAAAEQGHEVIRDSQAKAAQKANTIITDAQSRADDIIKEAYEKIEKEKAQAMEQMRGEITEMATEIAAMILRREVTAKDNMSLAEEYFREMRRV